MSSPVRFSSERSGQIERILLDRPNGNILDLEMLAAIREGIEHISKEPGSCKLLVFEGAGRHFSFGASVQEHLPETVGRMLPAFHRLFWDLERLSIPTAAVVRGQCLGGGFELVLACHFLFATPGARFGCPEIKLGVFPPVLAALGERRLGGFAAERMLLTGQSIDASEAWRLGFLTRVLDDGAESPEPGEALLAWYRETLRPLSAFALRQGTKALRQATGFVAELDRALRATEEQYLREVLESRDGNEGIEAYLARRQPVWRDE